MGLALTALIRIPGGFDESVEKALACSSVRRLTPIFDTQYAVRFAQSYYVKVYTR